MAKPDFTLYLDMDGVLANLADHFRTRHGEHHRYEDGRIVSVGTFEMLALIKGTDFFAGIPPFPETQAVLDYCRANFHTKILTSPMRGDREHTEALKRDWITRHCGDDLEVIVEGRKAKYAVRDGKPQLLVDDWSKNCNEWRAKGGRAILWRAAEHPLAMLKSELMFAKAAMKKN